MNCPKCNNRMSVIDMKKENNIVYRRYRCSCGEILYTREAESENAKIKIARIRARMRKDVVD